MHELSKTRNLCKITLNRTEKKVQLAQLDFRSRNEYIRYGSKNLALPSKLLSPYVCPSSYNCTETKNCIVRLAIGAFCCKTQFPRENFTFCS